MSSFFAKGPRASSPSSSLGDDPVAMIVRKPKGYASHFKRDIQNAFGFGIGNEVAWIRSDGHVKSAAEGNCYTFPAAFYWSMCL
jgi:hypothetical protein